jgi:hypothetical protein
MTLKEIFKDSAFIEALSTDDFIDTEHVAEFVGCSHAEARLRLIRLAKIGRVIRDKAKFGGRDGFRHVWKLNKDYINPTYIPRCEGLHIWDRGVSYNKYTFVSFAKICAKIAELSGIQLMDMEAEKYEPEFSENKVCFNGDIKSGADDDPFCITRAITSTKLHMRGDKGRYYDFCDTGNKPYAVVVIACLIALKQLSNRTNLSIGADYQTITKAVDLVERAGMSVNSNKFLPVDMENEIGERDIIVDKLKAWLEKD